MDYHLLHTYNARIASVLADLESLPGVAIGVLLLIAAAAVFSPLLRVKLRRSLTPVALAAIAILLFAGYLSTTGGGS